MEQKSKRTLSREYAFKFLYHYNLTSFTDEKRDQDTSDLEKKLNEFELSYTEKDKEHPDNRVDQDIRSFAHHLIFNIIKNMSDIENCLKSFIPHWKIEHLDRVDLTLLLLGTYEMKSELETPAKVIINEYVDLAKCYGTKDSYSFANGVLDQMAKKIRS